LKHQTESKYTHFTIILSHVICLLLFKLHKWELSFDFFNADA